MIFLVDSFLTRKIQLWAIGHTNRRLARSIADNSDESITNYRYIPLTFVFGLRKTKLLIALHRWVISSLKKKESPSLFENQVLAQQLSCGDWTFVLHLADTARWFGLITLSYKLREVAKGLLLEKNITKLNQYASKKYIFAMLENERFSDESAFCNWLHDVGLARLMNVSSFSSFVSLWFGTLNKPEEKGSALFKDFLQGKRVCVIGPVKQSAFNSTKIVVSSLYECDEVVKFNVDVTKSIGKGLKKIYPSVTYFNKEFCPPFDGNLSRFPNFLRHARLKAGPKANRWSKLEANDRPFLSIFPRFDRYCFHGTFNLLQLASVDLLTQGKCSKLSLLFVDLMISPFREAGYFSPDVAYSNLPFSTLNKGSHDPISNFVLIQRLFNHSFLVVDEHFASVLKLNASRYAEKLEKIYFKSEFDEDFQTYIRDLAI